MRKIIAAQGEVRIFRIDALPECIETKATKKNKAGAHIISHSEKGHHHVLPADAVVMERTDNIPAGMQILYALLDKPQGACYDQSTN